MRRLFLFIAVFSGLVSARGQDLIVTTDQDSIECRITKQDSKFVHFTYLAEDGPKSVMMENERILEIVMDFYAPKVPADAEDKSVPDIKEDYSRFHISGSLIGSRRTASVPDNLPEFRQDYFEELKGGNGLQGRAHIFFNEEAGVGFQVSTYEASHSISGEFTFEEPDSSAVGVLSSDVSLLFIGPSFMGRYYFPESSFMINYSVSLGYLRFRQEDFFIDTRTTFEGSSFGLNGDVGLELLLAENFALGVGVGFGLGAVSRVDVTENGETFEVELDEPEGLNRISFFGGVRFHI